MKALPPIPAPAELAVIRARLAELRQRRDDLPRLRSDADAAVERAVAAEAAAEAAAVQRRARALADGDDTAAAGKAGDRALAAARDRRRAAEADVAAVTQAERMIRDDMNATRARERAVLAAAGAAWSAECRADALAALRADVARLLTIDLAVAEPSPLPRTLHGCVAGLVGELGGDALVRDAEAEAQRLRAGLDTRKAPERQDA